MLLYVFRGMIMRWQMGKQTEIYRKSDMIFVNKLDFLNNFHKIFKELKLDKLKIEVQKIEHWHWGDTDTVTHDKTTQYEGMFQLEICGIAPRDLYRGWEVTKSNVCFHVLPNQIYKYLSAKITAISCNDANILLYFPSPL